jgi:hypothetical protein
MSANEIRPDLFRHDTEWNVAICTLCQHAVAGKTLQRHANGIHKIPYVEYKPCIDALQTKSIPYTLAEFPNPGNGIPAITTLYSRREHVVLIKLMRAFSIREPQPKTRGTRINVWEGHVLICGRSGFRSSAIWVELES